MSDPGNAALEADRHEIEQFYNLLFRYADNDTFLSLRIFDQFDRTKPALHIEGIKLSGNADTIIAAASRVATRAATATEPSVFAPPLATFATVARARGEDVSNGLTLSVELDQGDIAAARRRLEGLLGQATLVMESGGNFIDEGTGEIIAKLHLHWRLNEPTRREEDHQRLRSARWLAATWVGGDVTAAPPAHPLRWPGSWNTKDATPRLAHIIACNQAAEIDLTDALERLEAAIEAVGLSHKPHRRSGDSTGTTQAPIAEITDAVHHIPNDDVPYDQWVRMGYALYAATGGTGLELFREWSQQSGKHDDAETEATWSRIAAAGPNRIGVGTIFFLARQQGWQFGKGKKPPPGPEPLGVWDPWEDPLPPKWPNGILSPQAEETLTTVSLRDGVDFGVLCMTVISAASAAAPKNARLSPYVSTHWVVPPIIWCIVIGESGLRKTLLDAVAFAPIRALQSALWRAYRDELAAWRANGSEGHQPEQPHSHIVNDYTPEALQLILDKTMRGTAVVKDEIAGFFDFARYGGATNHGNRAFFLSAYDDQACPVHRIGRDSLYIEHTGISVFGAVQPDKLSKLTGLESDGLLQRFALLRVCKTTVSRPIPVKGLDLIHQAITRLCRLNGRAYASTPEGEVMIRATEEDAKGFAQITDYGLGWKGFCGKVHGTHARLALILHLLDNPDAMIVPAETVHRAARLTRFLLQHARDFYSLIPDGRMDLLRNIAGWLLTKKPGNPGEAERIVASDLTHAVRGCRPLGSKGIADVLDPFVTGGWLEPESDFPGNRAWMFNPTIREAFAVRENEERERRRLIREAIRKLEEPVP